jgi:hypothetical protein
VIVCCTGPDRTPALRVGAQAVSVHTGAMVLVMYLVFLGMFCA